MAIATISWNIILASKSPRRQNLLKELGFDFEIRTKEIEEVYSSELKREEVAVYLSELKASAFTDQLNDNDLVITSDTIVCLKEEIIGKPTDREDAIQMLGKLSSNKHEVITAVTLLSKEKQHTFYEVTEVYFKTLTLAEIEYYIDNYQPFDKAGSYGIQEWIGYIGIEKIVGSYFNVMGLPVQKLYNELMNF